MLLRLAEELLAPDVDVDVDVDDGELEHAANASESTTPIPTRPFLTSFFFILYTSDSSWLSCMPRSLLGRIPEAERRRSGKQGDRLRASMMFIW
jgi:hypothetical protein